MIVAILKPILGSKMNLQNYSTALKLLTASIFLGACQAPDLAQLKHNPMSFMKLKNSSEDSAVNQNKKEPLTAKLSLDDLLTGSLTSGDIGTDFDSVLKTALENDPVIIAARRNSEAKLAAIGQVKSQKDFQVSTTIYGGIEDVTDGTSGVALALDASRLVFDGGFIDAQVSSRRFMADSAKLELEATLNERAYRLGSLWVELEKYEALKNKIKSRLAVLDPLILQLERVAQAGIGDVSKVTAAQRTVSTIRVAETNISEGLAQAQLNFVNAFGALPDEINYDYEFVAQLVPSDVTDEMVHKAPLLLSQYATYQSNIANISAIRAKEDFKIGFEARAMRPFAGSGYDSDESIGLVARKTLFNDQMLESEMDEAKAIVQVTAENIKATHREGRRTIMTAQQNILSMDKAIALAKENAKLTADEIIYLKQQLVIGGSTLDSVLSAEARLYDAESKEINFLAEKQRSQLTIASALGFLATSLGL
jgi:outer membrane protein TolC